MKSIITIILLITLGFTSISYGQLTITITGSGVSAVNKTFTENGTSGGKIYFTDGGFNPYYFIRWETDKWIIGGSGSGIGSPDYYENTADTDNPPADGWTVGPNGVAPLPSLSGTGLPVTLQAFNATSKLTTIILEWQTATEKNNEGFEIERSADGENWQNIGFVLGHGTTQEVQDYTFTDETPLAGTNYYRLKQIDFDGQFEYSHIVNLELKIKNEELKIYPNPVQNEMVIINGIGQATIYNLLGQSIRQFSINDKQSTISTTDLPKGQYILHIQQQNGNIITKQFVK